MTNHSMPPSRAELAEAIEALGGRFTQAVADLHGLVVNDVLFSGMVKLDATGYAELSFRVPFGAIAVHNGGANQLNIGVDHLGGSLPKSGPGIHLIPNTCFAVINTAGRALGMSGTAGGLIHLQVFTRPQQPAYGYVASIA